MYSARMRGNEKTAGLWKNWREYLMLTVAEKWLRRSSIWLFLVGDVGGGPRNRLSAGGMHVSGSVGWWLIIRIIRAYHRACGLSVRYDRTSLA